MEYLILTLCCLDNRTCFTVCFSTKLLFKILVKYKYGHDTLIILLERIFVIQNEN